VREVQTELDLERDSVRHTTFLPLVPVGSMLETHGLAAVVAKIWPNGVKGAAVFAKDLCRVKRIYLNLGTAVFAVSTEMLQSLEVAAFALPVSDLVLDILKGRRFAKIRDG